MDIEIKKDIAVGLITILVLSAIGYFGYRIVTNIPPVEISMPQIPKIEKETVIEVLETILKVFVGILGTLMVIMSSAIVGHYVRENIELGRLLQ